MKVHSTYGTFELHLGQLGWRVILSGGGLCSDYSIHIEG